MSDAARQGNLLFDAYANSVRRLSVHCKNEVRLAAPGQVARQQDVRLVESRELDLRPGEKYLRRRPARDRRYGGERTAESEAGAEGHQEDQVRSVSQFGAEIDRNRNDLVLRVELGDGLEESRAVRFDSQREGGRDVGRSGAHGEKSGRGVDDLDRAARGPSIYVRKRYRPIARRRARRNQEIDLGRRNE